jgi:hypothetical protein
MRFVNCRETAVATQLPSDKVDVLAQGLARLAKCKSGPMALRLEHDARGTTAAMGFLDHALTPPHVLMAFKPVFFVQLARLEISFLLGFEPATCA